MKKKYLLLIIVSAIFSLVYISLPYIISIGKYEYLTTSRSPYSDWKNSYSKYALIISEEKYYIYNRITRTFYKDYSSFIKKINSKYNNGPNVCSNNEFIDYESGVKCNISDEYLKIYLWYDEGEDEDFDAVYIDNKGNVTLISEKENYRFGKYKAYGIFFETAYGNYEITLPTGDTYLIGSIDSEESWNTFELYNKDLNGNWLLEEEFEKFYINKDNAIFLTSNAVINPLSEKLEIGENYYDYNNPKIFAEDIYKDKYILVSNENKIEVRDIKNNTIAFYETDDEVHDIKFKLIESNIYIDFNEEERQLFIFDGKNIIKKEN